MVKATFENLKIRQMNETIGSCSLITVRRRADDSEVERSGYTYIFQSEGEVWKIRQLIETDIERLF